MSSYTRQQLETWIKTIDISGRVLDVGGSQKPANNRVNIVGDCTFEILDLENPHENSQKPSIAHDLNYRLPTDVPYEPYDNILCFEVMEYIWNPVQALQNMARLLHKGGHAYISTAFIYPVHNPCGQDCLRYTEAGMVKLFEETGFGINGVTSRLAKYPGGLMNWYGSEGMRPSRDYLEHDVVGHMWQVEKL